jgi:uncharacterized Rossmann fold enzyme
MLITEEYRRLNTEMHETMPNYGTGFKMNPKSIINLCKLMKTEDVLDYGCGKGGLALSGWLPFKMKMYDPAIPAYSERPDPAELVLCLDVMEHVEPECLDDVIKDLHRVASKFLIVAMALEPSRKLLPNGENSHVSLHTLHDWAIKFKKYFGIARQFIQPDDASLGWLYCVPKMNRFELDGQEDRLIEPEAPPLNLMDYSAVEFGEFQPVNYFPANFAYSMAMMGDRGFVPDPNVEIKEERIAVVGYGPSLVSSWEDLRRVDYKTIFSMSGSHNFLLEKGIVPTHHVEIDWKPHKPKFTENAHPDCQYFVSAVCNPATISNVKDKNSKLMFIKHGPQITYPSDVYVMEAGYDVGQQAIVMAMLLGYRNIDLYGFDYCFNLDKVRHAGDHGGRVHYAFPARVGNKVFYTSKTMFTALLVFEFFWKQHPELNIRINSDTLLVNFLEERMKEQMKGNTNG